MYYSLLVHDNIRETNIRFYKMEDKVYPSVLTIVQKRYVVVRQKKIKNVFSIHVSQKDSFETLIMFYFLKSYTASFKFYVATDSSEWHNLYSSESYKVIRFLIGRNYVFFLKLIRVLQNLI